MARLIIDTTVLVSAERNADELSALAGDDDDVAIAAITAAELLVSVELDGGNGKLERNAFVNAVLEAVAIEPYDLEVAEAHAVLLSYTQPCDPPRGTHDLIIAATARAREREVVTRDFAGFGDLPGVVLRAP